MTEVPDETPKILESIKRENPLLRNFYILHINKSVGKKRAVEAASQIARGDIYAFMDSDCDMDLDAVQIAAKIFMADKNLGALTGHVTVRNATKGNVYEKMQSVYADAACRGFKGAETCFDSVTCCSGALSFYKRECVQDFIHEWAHDKFLGMDFKFCTDRRMTAYVLTTPRRKLAPSISIIGQSGVGSAKSAELVQNGYRGGQPLVYPNGSYDDYSNSSYSPASSTYSTAGDGDGKSSSELNYWNVKYRLQYQGACGCSEHYGIIGKAADKMEKELYPKSLHHRRKLLEETGLHSHDLLYYDSDEVRTSLCGISCGLYVTIRR